MNQFLPKTAPFMGLPAHYSIADIPPRGLNDGIKALDAVVATTLSQPLSLGARGVEIKVSFANADGSCSLEVYKDMPGGPELLKRFDRVSRSNSIFYLGNYERVDVGGRSVLVKVVDPLNGAVTVFVKSLY